MNYHLLDPQKLRSVILTLWDEGFNTADIAEELSGSEAGIERELHYAMRERMAKNQTMLR